MWLFVRDSALEKSQFPCSQTLSSFQLTDESELTLSVAERTTEFQSWYQSSYKFEDSENGPLNKPESGRICRSSFREREKRSDCDEDWLNKDSSVEDESVPNEEWELFDHLKHHKTTRYSKFKLFGYDVRRTLFLYSENESAQRRKFLFETKLSHFPTISFVRYESKKNLVLFSVQNESPNTPPRHLEHTRQQDTNTVIYQPAKATQHTNIKTRTLRFDGEVWRLSVRMT